MVSSRLKEEPEIRIKTLELRSGMIPKQDADIHRCYLSRGLLKFLLVYISSRLKSFFLTLKEKGAGVIMTVFDRKGATQIKRE